MKDINPNHEQASSTNKDKQSSNTENPRTKPIENLDPSTQKSLRLISFLSNWLDTKFRIPGTGFRFGLDAVLSVVPVVGNVVSTGASMSVFALIISKGVPFSTAIKMMFNIIIDTLVSFIPLVGTIFDIGFKANTKNLNLLSEHIKNNPEGKYYNGAWWAFALALVLVLVLMVSIIIFAGGLIISAFSALAGLF